MAKVRYTDHLLNWKAGKFQAPVPVRTQGPMSARRMNYQLGHGNKLSGFLAEFEKKRYTDFLPATQ